MTIDECINDIEQVIFGAKMMKQTEVYKYHTQLVEWLKELKRWRNLKSTIIPKYRDGVSDEYNRGANDMWEEIIEQIEEVNADDELQ